jgi:hypothetical protein
MAHFRAVFSVVWAGETPLARGWLHGPAATNTIGHTRQAMYIISRSWGWSRPYSMAEYPGHAATDRARHALHTWWLLPSKGWSHTGPAQCVAYPLGQHLLIEGWPLGAYCAVLCASVQRGDAAVRFTANAQRRPESSAPCWLPCSITWWGVAAPGQ